ncbi:Uncharacterized protein QTN25_007779 [Entamoeba marina]
MQHHVVKLIVLGGGGVGKSAIVRKKFRIYRKLITVDREQVMLEIYDIAGTEQFKALLEIYIREGDGFIIVYSLINCDHIPIIIAGNKIDLEEDREVTFEEGQELSNKLGVDFMECSAKRDIKINELFHVITFDVMVNLPYTKKDTLTSKTRGCLLC